MGRVKINRTGEGIVKYPPKHLKLLDNLRKHAIKVTSVFAHHGIDSLTYGSVARGDITPKSDIDIMVEFSDSVGFFKFIKLERFLSKILKRKVDFIF